MQRRRRVFTRLLAVVSLSFVAGFVPQLRWAWFIHLAADTALALYVWRLLNLKRQEDAASPATSTTTTIVLPDPAPEPSIPTFRLDPEPSIAPAAGSETKPAGGWMIKTG